jgi:outer membrane immunogenic protein
MMRVLIVSSVAALLACVNAASAADVGGGAEPAYPTATALAFSWTGFYAGLQTGYQWSEADFQAPALNASGGYDFNGAVIGGRIGYDAEFGSLLAGVVGDLEFANGSGQGSDNGVDASGEINWQGSLRARFGYVYGNFLPYVTGGLALADVDFALGAGAPSDGFSDTAVGYTVGAGLEYAVTDKLSFGAEYRYSNYGTADNGSGTDEQKHDLDSHSVRAILSYRFGDLW